jgi:hypothetical protein
LLAKNAGRNYYRFMDERSIERRSGPDTIMLLQEIQKVAISAAQTSTDVALLRADFARLEKCGMSEAEVKGAIDDRLRDNRRWNVGTLVASIAAAAGLGALFRP